MSSSANGVHRNCAYIEKTLWSMIILQVCAHTSVGYGSYSNLVSFRFKEFGESHKKIITIKRLFCQTLMSSEILRVS